MRFVTTQKRSLSSATTKGHSGRSHHSRKSSSPMDFVGVDGEGVTLENGEHRYVLLGVGDKQISDPNGIDWQTAFDFLYSRYKRGTAFVGFFLGYDFTQIFKTLPEDKAWMLLTTEGRLLRKHRVPGKAPHPVQCDGWQFDILAMKRLRIRPKNCECENATCHCKQRPWMYVCDVGSFFQTSFVNVINPANWTADTCPVSEAEYADIVAGKKRRSTAVLDDEMRRYNVLENRVLADVMTTLDKGFLGIGVHLPASKWFGPGQAAQAWLKSEGVPTGEEIRQVVPQWFLEAARMAYFGGWFEIFMHGHIPGVTHEYDINSAYPSIIRSLPCLLHGQYSKGDGLPRVETDALCLVYAEVQSPGMPEHVPPIGTMLHRDTHGRILRPSATAGWYWHHELRAAESAGLVKRLSNRNVVRWVKYQPCKCAAPMDGIAGLYQKRLEVGKSSPLGKSAKLVYNSAYGKFAQSVGEPIYGNSVYASLITAGCRTQILKAISTHPGGIKDVTMVATDAVFFATRHPTLSVSTTLGEWDYKERTNLTQFKPGVYWDDVARQSIRDGKNPTFKARGFNAADFAHSIGRVDSQFHAWRNRTPQDVGTSDDRPWPTVKFVSNFSMTTALQALRQGHWSRAGRVSSSTELTQSSDPADKRSGLYRDIYDGRTIYRSRPHFGMALHDDGTTIRLRTVPSNPYTKRFGMDDPWSDDAKEQHGITEDGTVADELAWLLKGE
jgi:hypothetical protein